MTERFFWIIGGGLLQVPLIDEVRSLGLKTIVSDMSDSCACRNLADVFVQKDIFDINGHVEESARFLAEGKSIVGVLAAGIDAPETMAVIAKTLGLPGVQPKIAHLVHDKHEFRKRLKALGFPTPKFSEVTPETFDNLPEIVNSIGFPLIVKNNDSSGSRGTRLFHENDLDSIKATVQEAIRVSKSKKALIEECWEGPEQTVETIFDIEGNFHRCFITDRMFDRSNGYAMEVGLRNPSALPAEIQNEMYTIAENVARALGISVGAAKYDMMLTKDGPRIIEMTVRLSGGFDSQYLVPATSGKNVIRAAILTAIGEKFPPSLLEDTKKRVGLTESLWPEPGKITQINGLEAAKSLPGFERIFFRYSVGEVIEPYVDCTKRVCFMIVTGKDEGEARLNMERVKQTITIETGRKR